MKSTMAEKAAVELVQLFISHTDGLPEDEKKDFIVFEKLFQQVFAYNEGDHIEPCNVFLGCVRVDKGNPSPHFYTFYLPF